MQATTKAEAKAAGSKFYFTGVACKHGHVCPRFACDGSCTECKALQSKGWYSDKERSRKKTAKWREENPERDAANRRAWQAANPEKLAQYDRDYNERHPGRRKKSNRDWYQRNIDRERTRAIVKRNANIEEARAASRAYNKANPERIAAIARTRRARAKSSGGVHTAAEIAEIMTLQNGRCAYCREKLGRGYHVDHIMPLAKGGRNDRANLQLTCGPCNQSKSAKHPIAFAQSIGLLL